MPNSVGSDPSVAQSTAIFKSLAVSYLPKALYSYELKARQASDSIAAFRKSESYTEFPSYSPSFSQETEQKSQNRKEVINWFGLYQESMRYGFETVESALSMYDRATISSESLGLFKDQSLLALCCFYVAAKAFESQPVAASFLIPQINITLSNQGVSSENFYTEKDLYSMENSLLKMIDWRVSPPSLTRYFSQLSTMLGIPARALCAMEGYIEIQRDAVLRDSSFTDQKRFDLAFAIFMNALDWVARGLPSYISPVAHGEYQKQLLEKLGIHHNSDDVMRRRNQIAQLSELVQIGEI